MTSCNNKIEYTLRGFVDSKFSRYKGETCYGKMELLNKIYKYPLDNILEPWLEASYSKSNPGLVQAPNAPLQLS